MTNSGVGSSPTALSAGVVVAGKEHSYKLERELGHGGFGVTFLATRQSDGHQVALKSLHISRLSEWKSWELFERETSVLRRLSHPNIPDYVDDFALGDDPQLPEGLVLVQEFVDGYPLQAVVRGERSMTEAQMVSWLSQILEVLDYLHRLSPPVIHRDVTPKNILVRGDGVAYLVDFGTVQAAIRSATTVSSTSTGTFGYAPMEQFVGAAYPASDLYGLGMTCLAVASGKEPESMPFRGMRVDVRQLVRFDARLIMLLERMTEPDPERRLGDARVALEQLRPLVSRYSESREVSAPAMQRVVEVYRSKRTASARATVAADDLLPSERIREAGIRLGQLGGDALGIPRLQPLVEDADDTNLSADGTVLSVGSHILSVADLQIVSSLPGRMMVYASTPTADRLLAAQKDSWGPDKLTIFEREGSDYKDLGTIEVGDGQRPIVISPDGGSMVRLRDEEALLFDLKSKSLAQRVKGYFASVCFTADSGAVALHNDSDDLVTLLQRGGGRSTIRQSCGVAFSPDGQKGALFKENLVIFTTAEGVTQGSGGAKVKAGGHRWHHPQFSVDGRWLGVCDYSNDEILVFDVADAKLVLKLRSPSRPDKKVGSVRHIAFSADSTRLLVACDVHYNRFDSEDEDCVAIWSIPNGEYLGAVLKDEHGTPLLVAAAGFHGALARSDKPAKSGKRDKRDKRSSEENPWWRPEVARRALCGEPVDQLVDEKTRAQLADLEERWAFFHDLQATKQVDPDAGLPQLIDATRGLTHILDQVVREARRAQSEAVTFGGGDKAVALTSDQVIAAAQGLTRRPPEELAILHEQLISDAEQSEANRAATSRPQKNRSAEPSDSSPAEASSSSPEGDAMVTRAKSSPAVREAAAVERSAVSATKIALIVIGSAVALGLAITLLLS